jgi:hypothetical protein
MPYDSIGNFYFVRVEGQPQSVRYFLRDETRPGAPGVAFRRMPKRPIPFELTSYCLVNDEIEAAEAEVSFAAMVGEELFSLTLGNRAYDDIMVLDVQAVDQLEVPNCGGGISVFGVVNAFNGIGCWSVITRWVCIYAGEVAE